MKHKSLIEKIKRHGRRSLTTLGLLALLDLSCAAPNPKVDWEKTYSHGRFNVGEDVQQTEDGGYIITGTSDFLSGGNENIYLAKTDSQGNLVWQKFYGGKKADLATALQKTNDEGFVIGGITNSFGAGKWDAYLIKTNILGEKLWEKTFGGENNDIVNDVKQTKDDGYVIVGATFPRVPPKEQLISHVYLAKTNPLGEKLWEKIYDDTNLEGIKVEETNDDGYLVLASSYNKSYLIKTDSLGNKLWYKEYDSGKGSYLMKTKDMAYIIATSSSVLKTDSTGNILWKKQLDLENISSSYETKDGGYVVIGSGERGTKIIKVINVDYSGNKIWESSYMNYKDNTHRRIALGILAPPLLLLPSRDYQDTIGKVIQETNDGGFITSGYITNSNLDIYMLKTEAASAPSDNCHFIFKRK